MIDRKLNTYFFSHFSLKLLLILLAIIISLPLLLPLRAPVYNDDFLMYCTQLAIIRESVLQFKTIALETPALAGGYPTVANPENPALNPLIILPILYGEIIGLKLIYMFYTILAGLGAYWLCRYSLHMTDAGAFFAGASLILSAFLPGKYVGGNPYEVQLVIFPLGIHLLLQSRDKRFFFGLIAFGWVLLADTKFIALIFWLYVFVTAILWDSEYLRRNASLRPRGIPLTILAFTAFCLTFLLGAIKILPVIDFFRNAGGFHSSTIFKHALSYADIKSLTIPELIRGLADPALIFWRGSVDNAMTIGPVVFLAAVVSLVIFSKRSWRIWFLVIFSAWLACANNLQPDLFKILWKYIPVFNLIDKPGKYFGPLTTTFLCIAAGILISEISKKLSKKNTLIVVAIILIVSAPFTLALHLCARRQIIHVRPEVLTNLRRVEKFFQVETRQDINTPLDYPDRSISYFNFKSGVGTVDAYLPIRIGRYAIPRYFKLPGPKMVENPRYVGEIEHPERKIVAGDVNFEPNKIVLRLRESVTETIIINRNFDPDWRSEEADIVNYNGRLAVIPKEPDCKEIILLYKPKAFYIGALVSLFTFLGILFYWNYHQIRRLFQLIRNRFSGRADPRQLKPG